MAVRILEGTAIHVTEIFWLAGFPPAELQGVICKLVDIFPVLDLKSKKYFGFFWDR